MPRHVKTGRCLCYGGQGVHVIDLTGVVGGRIHRDRSRAGRRRSQDDSLYRDVVTHVHVEVPGAERQAGVAVRADSEFQLLPSQFIAVPRSPSSTVTMLALDRSLVTGSCSWSQGTHQLKHVLFVVYCP
jgi:hypothetical protein